MSCSKYSGSVAVLLQFLEPHSLPASHSFDRVLRPHFRSASLQSAIRPLFRPYQFDLLTRVFEFVFQDCAHFCVRILSVQIVRVAGVLHHVDAYPSFATCRNPLLARYPRFTSDQRSSRPLLRRRQLLHIPSAVVPATPAIFAAAIKLQPSGATSR